MRSSCGHFPCTSFSLHTLTILPSYRDLPSIKENPNLYIILYQVFEGLLIFSFPRSNLPHILVPIKIKCLQFQGSLPLLSEYSSISSPQCSWLTILSQLKSLHQLVNSFPNLGIEFFLCNIYDFPKKHWVSSPLYSKELVTLIKTVTVCMYAFQRYLLHIPPYSEKGVLGVE